MSRVHVPMPSLVHGVSQLSAAERQPVHALVNDDVWPIVDKGSEKRPPLIHVAKVVAGGSGDRYCHGIDRGSGEQYISLFGFGATTANGVVFDLTGTVIPVFKNTGSYAAPVYVACDYTYLASGSNPTRTIRALSVLDYTFLTNRNVAVTMATTTTTSSPTTVAHVFIRQGAFAMKYTVKIKNSGATTWVIHASTRDAISTDFSANRYSATDGHDVWDYSRADPGTGTTERTSVKSQDIAEALKERLAGNATVGLYGSNVVTAGQFTVTREGSVLKIVSNNGAITTFEVSTSQGDQLAFGIQNETSAFSNLPLIFTHNYVVKIVGNALANEDDFWVKFTSDTASASLSKGTWSETNKPGITYTWIYTPSSLHPHVLVRRTSDGVNPASVAAGGKFFSFEPANLGERVVGDTTSNPNPSFVSVTGTYQPSGGGGTTVAFPVVRKVQGFAFFRDRLVICCDESLSCSEQGQYLNFFRTTVRSLPDSDPIDVSISGDRTTVYHSLVPMFGKLVCIAEQVQSRFFGNPNLTPGTVEGTQVSQFHTTPFCAPQAYKDGILYPALSGAFTTLRSLFPKPNTEDVFDSENLSIHTPTYIPGNPKQIEVNADSSVIAVLCDGDPDSIYILKQHREGDRVIQSAWCRFTTGASSIQGIKFFGSKLYVVLTRIGVATPTTYVNGIGAGFYFSCALKSDGDISAWGNNPVGQLNVPALPGGVTYTKLACGSAHGLAIRSDGNAVGWGWNLYGQDLIPTLPGGGVTYTECSAGYAHSLLRRSDGNVVAFGYNANLQCSVPTLTGGLTYTKVAAGGQHSLGLVSDGTVRAWGSNGHGQTTVPTLSGGLTYTAIAGGDQHSLGLVSDGTIRAWGWNNNGQLNVPTLPSGVTYTAVACGVSHSIALRSDGNVVAWGAGGAGQTTVPALPGGGVTYTSICGGLGHSMARRSDGVVVAWGLNDFGQCNVPTPFQDGTAVTDTFLEYVDLAAGVDDSGRSYWTYLDRRFSNPSMSYSAGTGKTTITAPYAIEDGVYMEAVDVVSNVRYIGTVVTATTFTVVGDVTALSIVAGKRYTSIHSFHKPQVQVNSENGRRLVLDSTSAVVALGLRYEDTSYFKVAVETEITHIGSSTGPQTATATVLAGTSAPEPRSGTVTVGVGGRLDSPFDVSVQNDTPFRHTLVSGEWILNAHVRSPALR